MFDFKLLVFPVLGLLAGCVSGAAPELGPAADDVRLDRYQWRGELADGVALRVENPFGNIEARRSNEGDVLVIGNIQQRIGDERLFKIDVVEDGDINVSVRHGSAAHSDRGVGPDGDFVGRVDVVVLVPDGAQLGLHGFAGDVKVKRLTADVVASTDSGSMAFDTAGSVQATTLHGSITASIRDGRFARPLLFKTKTGAIRLRISELADLNARLGGGESLTVTRPGSPAVTPVSRSLSLLLGDGGQDLLATSEAGPVFVEIM